MTLMCDVCGRKLNPGEKCPDHGGKGGPFVDPDHWRCTAYSGHKRCNLPGSLSEGGGKWKCAWHFRNSESTTRHDFNVWLCKRQIQIYRNKSDSIWLSSSDEIWKAVNGLGSFAYSRRLDPTEDYTPTIKKLKAWLERSKTEAA